MLTRHSILFSRTKATTMTRWQMVSFISVGRHKRDDPKPRNFDNIKHNQGHYLGHL